MVAYFDPHPNETIYQAQNSHRLPASLEVPTPNSMAGCWLGGWWFLSSKPTEFRTKEFCIKLISVLNEAAMPNTSRPKKRPGHAVPGNRQEPIWVPNGLSTYDYSDYRLKTNDGLGGKNMRGRILWIKVLIICLFNEGLPLCQLTKPWRRETIM